MFNANICDYRSVMESSFISMGHGTIPCWNRWLSPLVDCLGTSQLYVHLKFNRKGNLISSDPLWHLSLQSYFGMGTTNSTVVPGLPNVMEACICCLLFEYGQWSEPVVIHRVSGYGQPRYWEEEGTLVCPSSFLFNHSMMTEAFMDWDASSLQNELSDQCSRK